MSTGRAGEGERLEVALCRLSLPRVDVDLAGITPAVGCVCAADAAVVAEEGFGKSAGALQVVGEDRDAVTDVRLYVEEIARPASPLSCVERHDLHQPASADEARRPRIEPRILSQQHPDKERGADFSPPPFLHQRGRDAVCTRRIARVTAQNGGYVRLVTSFRKAIDCAAPCELGRGWSLLENQVENLRKAWARCTHDHRREPHFGSDGVRSRHRAVGRKHALAGGRRRDDEKDRTKPDQVHESYTNNAVHGSIIRRQLPELHLVERTDWNRDAPATCVVPDVSRLHDIAGQAPFVTSAKKEHARVVPARDHEPSAAERLDAIEFAVSRGELR